MSSAGICKLSDALARASRCLADAGIDAARQDARILLSHVTGLTRSQLVTESETSLDTAQQTQFNAVIVRRAGREPVSHILGQREFWSLSFVVSGAVLDPRPDSEALVDAALHHCPDNDVPLSIIDLGTGSGCLLLSLLSEWPTATGVGVDISDEALAVATRNADRLGMASRVRFLRGDWSAAVDGSFDIAVSNPPYISTAEISVLEPEVVNFEPHVALDGGADGLSAYRRLLPEMRRLLSASGIGVVEIGAGQRDAVAEILDDSGLSVLDVRQDLAGFDRCVVFKSRSIFTVT